MAHDELVARSILAALGIHHAELSPVGVGLASDAWLIREGDGRQVLRIATYPEDPVTYPSEHAIMAMLHRSGAPVPEPIVGSWEIQGWPGPAFSVTSYLPGNVLQPDALVWADEPIAAFLRILHRRLEGYGPVDEIDGRVRGRHQDAEVGTIDAWSGAPIWPLGGATLDRHPALMDLPDLARSMERHTAAVREVILGGPARLLHCDLHNENILQDDRHLGFIDFGVAFAGVPEWEFAALAYFLGWDMADRTLARYLDRPRDVERWRLSIALVALSLGARRWEQDRAFELDEDAHNATFLREALRRV